MKKPAFPVVILLFVSLFFTRCSPDYVDYRATTKEIISQGTWSVDYYFQGQDKTSEYVNAQFTFHGNGSITCLQDSVTYSGSWTTIKDVNRNDILIVNLGGQNTKFSSLNQQWNVTALGFKMVDMKDNVNNEWRIKQL